MEEHVTEGKEAMSKAIFLLVVVKIQRGCCLLKMQSKMIQMMEMFRRSHCRPMLGWCLTQSRILGNSTTIMPSSWGSGHIYLLQNSPRREVGRKRMQH